MPSSYWALVFTDNVSLTKIICHINLVNEYRDQPWFAVFKHSMDHEEDV